MNAVFKNFIRIQGAIFLLMAASLLIPLFLAFYYDEDSCKFAFLLVSGSCALAGIIIRLGVKPADAKFKVRDGFLIVSTAWLVCSVIGALPFLISGAISSAADAFFESCSGFSTTGASILTDVEVLPKSIMFWRSFTHWLGGMGIIVFVMALMPVLGINGQIAANAETPGPTKDKLTARFSDTAKNLYKLYLVFTLVQVFLLCLGGMSVYDSFLHTFGSLGTGGFSNYNDSVGHFNTYIQIVILIFMILAGMNFNLFFVLQRKGLRKFLHDDELRFYLAVIGIASTAIFICNQVNSNFKDTARSLLDSFFQVVSILTTTGYVTDDYDLWPTFSRMILFCLFFFNLGRHQMRSCSGLSEAGAQKCFPPSAPESDCADYAE